MRKSLRFAVLERDQFRCRYCGAAPDRSTLQVDHIFPKSQGGKDELDNLATACWDCNIGKGARVLRPIPPKRRYNVRTPSRDVDMEALRLEFPEGSHCCTPLKIAAIGAQFGLRNYAAAHKYVASLADSRTPMPPLRKNDYAWDRIVRADIYHQEVLVTALARKVDAA